MSIVSLADFSKLKSRPSRYHAKDAPYATGGNRGFYIASLPKPYPKNKPQKIVSALADLCKITAGMSKKDLMTGMKECVTAENYEKAKKGIS